MFVERLLPLGILRPLTPAEHDEYRRPFREPGEARRPTLSWPRQLPIAGEPRTICELVERYASFLSASPLPKLFINAEPGRLLTGELREACRRWPNQTEVTVSGLHYIQEDSPAETSLEALRAVGEIATVKRSLELYRAQPMFEAPQDFSARLREMMLESARTLSVS